VPRAKRQKPKEPDQIEYLAETLIKYKLDSIEAFGITMTKSRHDYASTEAGITKQNPVVTKPEPTVDPDEILAWSTLNAGRY
jgi:hypothetical protein